MADASSSIANMKPPLSFAEFCETVIVQMQWRTLDGGTEVYGGSCLDADLAMDEVEVQRAIAGIERLSGTAGVPEVVPPCHTVQDLYMYYEMLCRESVPHWQREHAQ